MPYAKTQQLEIERRKKISMKMKGKMPKHVVAGWNKGKSSPWAVKNLEGVIPWNKGKSGLQINSMKGKKRPEFSGNKHPMWKGGIARSSGLQIRRERERNAIGSHSKKEWELLKARYGFKCSVCGNKENLSKDHITPLVKGGNNFIGNIQPLCKRCNSRKGTKLLLVTRPPIGLYI